MRCSLNSSLFSCEGRHWAGVVARKFNELCPVALYLVGLVRPSPFYLVKMAL